MQSSPVLLVWLLYWVIWHPWEQKTALASWGRVKLWAGRLPVVQTIKFICGLSAIKQCRFSCKIPRPVSGSYMFILTNKLVCTGGKVSPSHACHSFLLSAWRSLRWHRHWNWNNLKPCFSLSMSCWGGTVVGFLDSLLPAPPLAPLSRSSKETEEQSRWLWNCSHPMWLMGESYHLGLTVVTPRFLCNSLQLGLVTWPLLLLMLSVPLVEPFVFWQNLVPILEPISSPQKSKKIRFLNKSASRTYSKYMNHCIHRTGACVI